MPSAPGHTGLSQWLPQAERGTPNFVAKRKQGKGFNICFGQTGRRGSPHLALGSRLHGVPLNTRHRVYLAAQGCGEGLSLDPVRHPQYRRQGKGLGRGFEGRRRGGSLQHQRAPELSRGSQSCWQLA